MMASAIITRLRNAFVILEACATPEENSFKKYHDSFPENVFALLPTVKSQGGLSSRCVTAKTSQAVATKSAWG